MRTRTTVKLSEVLEVANNALKHTADEETTERRTVCFMVEALLHRANAYRGFKYLDGSGITFDRGKSTIHDDTRRYYFLARGYSWENEHKSE